MAGLLVMSRAADGSDNSTEDKVIIDCAHVTPLNIT